MYFLDYGDDYRKLVQAIRDSCTLTENFLGQKMVCVYITFYHLSLILEFTNAAKGKIWEQRPNLIEMPRKETEKSRKYPRTSTLLKALCTIKRIYIFNVSKWSFNTYKIEE
jgi:hypothetical protein